VDSRLIESLLLVGIGAVITGLACTIASRFQMKKLMQRLIEMLDKAISGDFQESNFNESMESAVEEKLSHFLKSSVLSSQRLSKERDKIKELIADISHQTKTPISNLLLYSQLLEESSLSRDCRQTVEEIHKQAEKLHFLIVSLINLSRLETGIIQVNPQRGSLEKLLEAVEHQAKLKAETKGISLSFLPTETEAQFDPKWTEEALYNLVDNAIKYTPKGGNVEISVITYEMFVCIQVKDNGIGIKEEEQGRIFGRFYRSELSRDKEGVGIGLFLAREIAAAQNGYIKVKSLIGKGSCFSLFLPRG
jgi:signal transduction histidine kinase